MKNNNEINHRQNSNSFVFVWPKKIILFGKMHSI